MNAALLFSFRLQAEVDDSLFIFLANYIFLPPPPKAEPKTPLCIMHMSCLKGPACFTDSFCNNALAVSTSYLSLVSYGLQK